MITHDDDDGLTIPTPGRGDGGVKHSFWTLLAYQHDGLAPESEAARLAHIDAAKSFWWSRSVLYGMDIAKREFVREIRAARERFAYDLQREKEWLDYKAGLRSIPYPVVGPSRDWRTRRYLPPPPNPAMPWANWQPSFTPLRRERAPWLNARS